MKNLPDLTTVSEQTIRVADIIVRRPAWRAPMDPQVVAAIAESEAKLTVLLVLIGEEYVLADGEKNLRVAKDQGREDIAAKVVVGDEWLRLALMGATNVHGQVLTVPEKESLLTELLIKDPFASDTSIAKATGFSAGKVKSWREKVPGADTDLRRGPDGRIQRVNSEARSAAAKAAAAKKAEQQTGGAPAPAAPTAAPTTGETGINLPLPAHLALIQTLERHKAEVVAAFDGWILLLRTSDPEPAVLDRIKMSDGRLSTALSLDSSESKVDSINPEKSPANNEATAVSSGDLELVATPRPSFAEATPPSTPSAKPGQDGRTPAEIALRLLRGDLLEHIEVDRKKAEAIRIAAWRRKGKLHRYRRGDGYVLKKAA